jgi:hypothetical protein
MEANGLSRLLRKANPGVTLSHHQVDLTQLAGPDAALLPEEYFLHVSEPTDLRFMNDDGTVQGDVSLPGCPNTRPVTRACRLQVFLNGSRRYVYNVSTEAFQAWKAAQLKRSGRALNLLILDNHAPGFVESMGWGKQTVVVAGGSLREFREQQIGPPGGSWDQVYNDGVIAWLSSLADSFAQEGNAVLLNADRSLFHPMMLAQIKAARGLFTDVHHPEGLIGGSQYQALLDLIQTLVNTDGVVDLGGMWCHTGPSGYTAGLYTSPVARYRMWRLSSYYLLKQPFGSKGTVYFDPAFCSNTSGKLCMTHLNGYPLMRSMWDSPRVQPSCINRERRRAPRQMDVLASTTCSRVPLRMAWSSFGLGTQEVATIIPMPRRLSSRSPLVDGC